MKLKRPPTLESLLSSTLSNRGKPIAFVLAGHNGSGKSTLWYLRMADRLEMPLINADRLTSSILPEPPLPEWAIKLRDQNDDWQRISQHGVRVFRELVMDQNISFAYETVFSYWKKNSDDSYASKADDIQLLQKAGYFVMRIHAGWLRYWAKFTNKQSDIVLIGELGPVPVASLVLGCHRNS